MKAALHVRVDVRINGRPCALEVPAATTLAELLRAGLGLSGTKIGCGVGECGACTVLVDGDPVLACLMLAAEADGRAVTTIEADDEPILRLQRAFVQQAGLQCGFCTPGMILAASRLPPGSDAKAIRAALAGNICRCTGYTKIVSAVERAQRTGVRAQKERRKTLDRAQDRSSRAVRRGKPRDAKKR